MSCCSRSVCVTSTLIAGTCRCGCLLMWICTTVTTVLKIVLLVFGLHATNSIFVRIYPPSNGKGECESLTILTGANNGLEYYELHPLPETSYDTISRDSTNLSWIELSTILEHDGVHYLNQKDSGITRMKANLILTPDCKEMSYFNYSTSGTNETDLKIYNLSNIYNEDLLVGSDQDWFKFSDNDWTLVNENYGYRAQYAYCQVIRGFITFPWIPIVAWIVVTLLPCIFLTIILNFSNLQILLDFPGIVLMSIVSHFQVGPTSINGTRHYSLSNAATIVNMVLTVASTVCMIFLVTTGFGPGDGRSLRFVIPLMVNIPLCLISVLLSLILLCVTRCTEKIFYSEKFSKFANENGETLEIGAATDLTYY